MKVNGHLEAVTGGRGLGGWHEGVREKTISNKRRHGINTVCRL